MREATKKNLFQGFLVGRNEVQVSILQYADDDDEDDDDDVSCSSSDLFELDHLIGAARYQEELPVYETTNLETNKAIASGLCL